MKTFPFFLSIFLWASITVDALGETQVFRLPFLNESVLLEVFHEKEASVGKECFEEFVKLLEERSFEELGKQTVLSESVK
ncbi:MAG: hypothetical protein AAF226_13890, partial [Verrucomicrobiota bacterium]